MIWVIFEQTSVIQTDWYGGPLRSNLSPFCQTNPTDLSCSNDCPFNFVNTKVIMKLMERGLDFYIDKPYNLLY